MTPAVVAARDFPDTSNGIFVFDDQLDTGAMSEAQFAFAATHVVGTQKIVVSAVRRLRQINPNFLVLHYRLGPGTGPRATLSLPPSDRHDAWWKPTVLGAAPWSHRQRASDAKRISSVSLLIL